MNKHYQQYYQEQFGNEQYNYYDNQQRYQRGFNQMHSANYMVNLPHTYLLTFDLDES